MTGWPESAASHPGSASELAESVHAEAERRGFAAVGIAAANPSRHGEFLREWLDRGFHGEMEYLAREDAVARREDIRRSLEGARSVIVVAEAYPGQDEAAWADDPSRAVIARYARGRDYHLVLKERLDALAGWLDRQVAGKGGDDAAPPSRAWVDTGPILEREHAQRAGLGWFGRNTMLIRPGVGSYLLLGVILTPNELEPDAPFEADRCGTCRACLDACPTGALLGRDAHGAPIMDARRCISYLTIEQKGPIPEEFREAIGNRVFGCDICQEVCPWNERFPEEVTEPSDDGGPNPVARAAEAYRAMAWPADSSDDPPLPSLDGPDLVELTERILTMSGKEYRRVFAESPLARPGRKGMLRNLCVALGNYGATSAEAAGRVRPVLEWAATDRSELVREHAEWGLDSCRRR